MLSKMHGTNVEKKNIEVQLFHVIKIDRFKMKIDLFELKQFAIIKRCFSLNLPTEKMMHDTAYLAITY